MRDTETDRLGHPLQWLIERFSATLGNNHKGISVKGPTILQPGINLVNELLVVLVGNKTIGLHKGLRMKIRRSGRNIAGQKNRIDIKIGTNMKE